MKVRWTERASKDAISVHDLLPTDPKLTQILSYLQLALAVDKKTESFRLATGLGCWVSASLARRIGKTVKIRCGPAAVTGNDAYTLPLQSFDCGKE